ncbi:MAG: type III-A CRISPR-associated RAMP protein Csm5 [Bacteroidota bacterium]
MPLYSINTITPVHISGGNIISPPGYIYHDNKVHYVVPDRLAELLGDDEFSRLMLHFYAPSRDSNMKISDTVRKYLPSVTSQTAECSFDPQNKQIRRFISTAGQVFIPGSSLKGLFRTAILYDYLKNSEDGIKYIRNLGFLLDNIGRQISRIRPELMSIEGQTRSAKDFRLKNQMKQKLDGLLRPFRNKISAYLNDMEKLLFGPSTATDFMKYVFISDTLDSGGADKLYIDQLSRIKYSDGSLKNIPLLPEFLKEHTGLTFRMEVRDPSASVFKYEYFRDLTAERIQILTSGYCRDMLMRETTTVPKSREFMKLRAGMNSLLHTPEDIILIRLGHGKSFFYNSVLGLLDDQMLLTYRETERIGTHPGAGTLARSLFPASARYLTKNGIVTKPAGWCVVKNMA